MRVFQTSASYLKLITEVEHYRWAETPLYHLLDDWVKGRNNLEYYRQTYMLTKKQFERLLSDLMLADRIEPVDDLCYWHLRGKHYRNSDKVFAYNTETKEYDFISKLTGGIGIWWKIEFTSLELEALLGKLGLQNNFFDQLMPEPVNKEDN